MPEATVATDEEFTTFYASVFARLVGQLTLVTGELHAAEDVVQEALARASTRWARLRAYDLPEAWVRRVALNLAADRARRDRRLLRALARVAAPVEVAEPPLEGTELLTAMRALSVRHRQVLVLHYLVGMSIGETATTLAVSPGTVKSRLSRGRQMLAARLGVAEEAEEAEEV